MLKAAQLNHFHQSLLTWYRSNGRHHLPWRNTASVYEIWLSEVMLQQTTVAAVLSRFYQPFLTRFPTIESLAAASQQEVLQQWQGLGYYSRARNLHAAAQQIAANELPSNADGWHALPGIGKNTAHAVAAFALHQPVAIMEANVKRVACRIFALENPTPAQCWQAAETLLNPQQPFDHNQAMMDLGSQICTPKAPSCPQCPASGICQGQSQPQRYPQKKAKAALPIRPRHIILMQNGEGELYLTARETRLLNGMWQFPEVEKEDINFSFSGKKYEIKRMQPLGFITHDYSHFRLEAHVWRLKVTETQGFLPLAAVRKLPLTRTENKILQLLRAADAEDSLFRQNIS